MKTQTNTISQLINKTLILFMIFTIPSLLFCQTDELNLKKVKTFSVTEDFYQDSLYLFLGVKNFEPEQKYCVATQEKNSKYSLTCWHGMIGLENPSLLKNKLKIKIKKEVLILKLGKIKRKYFISKIANQTFLLTKKE